MIKAMIMSERDDWETPTDLFEKLNKEFNFQLDVCASDENAKCKKYFTKKNNALKLAWNHHESIFMNPPYGRKIGPFIKRAYEESQLNCTVVCLLPARTDTKWFHDYCVKGEIRFIKGRLKFSNSKNNAPFPSMIVIFRPNKL